VAALRLDMVLERISQIGHSSGLDLLRGVWVGIVAEVRLREPARSVAPARAPSPVFTVTRGHA
ncbi:MAG: hypothetical protein ABJA11_09525, partial [Pseudolysinimonas sp.]